MHFGRSLFVAVLGLAILTLSIRSGESADEVAKPSGSSGTTATQSAEPKPTVAFDLNQLPAGKTIGVVPGDARILKALDETADFDLSNSALGRFAEQITDNHKFSVKLDVAALTADGKGTETLLNGKTTGTSLRAALKLTLEEHGLTYVVENDTLLITTKTAAETKVSSRIYQVHDLVFIPNDPYLRPDFESLTELISSTVQPESWREAGGTAGEIRGFQGPGIAVLVIQHTENGHEQVEKLLADLRAAKVPALLEMQKKRMIPPPKAAPTGTSPVVISPIPVVGQGQGMGAGF